MASIRDALGKRRAKQALIAKGYNAAGLNLAAFEINQSPAARKAMSTILAELGLFKEICDTGKIKLRIVNIPFFPQEFYETQHGTGWTAKIDSCDYLMPDRTVAAFAQSNNIPFLSLANYFVAQKLSTEDIRELYLTKGSGHFSEAGHRLCAKAVFDAFYASGQQ